MIFVQLSAPRFEVSASEALWSFVIIIALMALNAIFRSGDNALSALRGAKIRDLIEARDPRARRLEKLNEESYLYLATCQIGSRFCRAAMYTVAVLASPWLARLWSGRDDYGIGWLIAGAFFLVFLIGLVNLILAESLFSGLARNNAEKWSLRIAPYLSIARIILFPFVWLIGGLASFFTRRLGLWPIFTPPVVTEEDLKDMVEASGASGELIEDEKEMIHSIIEFTDTVAREVMTPRTDIDAVERTASAQEVAKIIHETGHTRIPVYEGSIDRVVGIVHAKDLLKALLDGNGQDIGGLMRAAHFIPGTKDLHQLLTEFRKSRSSMAIVQDEFGGTAGLVTIEDLVEEIVGEIVDEYDVEEQEVQPVSENSWLIDGKAHLDDVNDEIGSNFESEEFDTLGGLLFGLFGRQPGQGEEIDQGDWILIVAETDGRRVVRVLAKKRASVA
ncbi:MAG: hemolysin family protein [Fimbriimonadales bacterium]